MNFDEAFDRLLGHEGGYVNDPRDPGGETMWGITKRVALVNGYTGPMREMTQAQAKAIYLVLSHELKLYLRQLTAAGGRPTFWIHLDTTLRQPQLP